MSQTPQARRSFFSRFTTFESLGIRDYRLLWLGQVNTSMGQWMDQVTRGWLMYELTGSALQLGLASAVRGLPLIFFSVLAGALADRSGRKAQLIIAQVTNAALNIILATLVWTGTVEPWHIYVTGFIAGSVQAFQQPARQTLIGDIVGDRRLMNALALNSTALNGSRTIGPAVAGGLIAALGIAGSYYVQGFMYIISTVWTAQMRVPERRVDADRPTPMQEPMLQSIRTGFAYVAQERDIRSLMLLGLGPLTFGMAYSSLMPIIAKDVLHGGVALQGVILSVIGIGSLVGSLTVATLRTTHGSGKPIVIGATAFSVFVFLFASSTWIPLTIALGALIGISNVTYNTQNQTLLQVITPRHLRGRVMSIRMLERGIVPFASALAGLLAQWFGGPNALRLMSLSGFAIVVLVMVTTPSIWRLRVDYQDLDAVNAGRGPARRGLGVPAEAVAAASERPVS